MSDTPQKSILRGFITLVLIISWLSSSILIAISCYRFEKAVSSVVTWNLFFAWSFFLVFLMFKKRGNMAFLLFFIPLLIGLLWPVVQAHPIPLPDLCRNWMYQIFLVDDKLEESIQKNPDVLRIFPCPLDRQSQDEAKTYHTSVSLPQAEWNEKYKVISHIRVKETPEDFAAVMPYMQWKAQADFSIYRTYLGLPIPNASDSTVCVSPLDADWRSFCYLSAAGFISCVENSATLSEFSENLRRQEETETRFHEIYHSAAYWTVIASILITEILMIMFLRMHLRFTITHDASGTSL